MGQQLALPLCRPDLEARILLALEAGPSRVPAIWEALGIVVPPAGGVRDALVALTDAGLVRCDDAMRWERT